MIGLYTLGAAHGAPGFDVGAENMPRRPVEGPGRHKADIGDYFGGGGCAVSLSLNGIAPLVNCCRFTGYARLRQQA